LGAKKAQNDPKMIILGLFSIGLALVLFAVYVALIVQRLFSALAGADTDHVVHRVDEDDSPPACLSPRMVAMVFSTVLAEDDVALELGQQGAPRDIGVSWISAASVECGSGCLKHVSTLEIR
jgi:hypothetical protein